VERVEKEREAKERAATEQFRTGLSKVRMSRYPHFDVTSSYACESVSNTFVYRVSQLVN
jgi:hypothetical protein